MGKSSTGEEISTTSLLLLLTGNIKSMNQPIYQLLLTILLEEVVELEILVVLEEITLVAQGLEMR